MRTTSYSDLRKNLAATLERVTQDHEPVVITRDRGKPAAVLISLEDFASYEETAYLLKSPRNAERLINSVNALDAGEGKERKLSERSLSSRKRPGRMTSIGRRRTPKFSNA
jgi:antitoxin YefM